MLWVWQRGLPNTESSSRRSSKSRASSKEYTSNITLGNSNNKNTASYDLGSLSERGNYILDMLETAEVHNVNSANGVIENALKQGKIDSNDADIMKKYYKEYVNSK